MYEATRSEGFGSEVQQRLLTGALVLSAEERGMYYDTALAVRNGVRADFMRTFYLSWDGADGSGNGEAHGVHCLLTPTVRHPVLTMT